MGNTQSSLNKIVFLDRDTLNSKTELAKINSLAQLIVYPETKPNDVLDRIQDAQVIITNKVVITKEHMQKCPSLKLVCIAATGMNNVDLDAAAELDIVVKNVKGYSTNSVVQHTFAMLFSITNKIKSYSDYVKGEQWINSSLFTCQRWPITEIKNKKWGIIGLGQIGRKVADVASIFGASVQYFSTSGKNIHQQYEQVSLEQLLTTSDIVSIHAPLNLQTKNLLNSKNLNLIKSDSILLNLGRGGIINEDDLLESLKSNNYYVALDVIETEPMLDNTSVAKLNKLENVLITPHVAWASLEAQATLVEGIYLNIVDHFSL